MSSECKIHVENYHGIYCGGANIVGEVTCYLEDETTVRGIEIHLTCREHNDWHQSESYYDASAKKSKTRRVHYQGTDFPIRLEQKLFGPNSGSVTLEAGRHCFPFSFTLPKTGPSSFSGPYGSVSYRLKAVVDRPMAFDYEDIFSFTVKTPVDLSSFPEMDMLPNNYADEKTTCCWCCKGGVITMEVDLPKNAFMPGEVVNFKVDITNLSNVNVDALIVNFQKEISFKATSPKTKYREDMEDILSMTEHGVGAHGQYTYDLQMIIPEYLEVPNFSLCNLFEAKYILTVTAEMDGCTWNLDIYIYPKMGHINTTNYNRKPGTPQIGFVSSSKLPPPAPGFIQPDPPPFPGNSEKPVYPGGQPTAPFTFADAPPESASASAPLAVPESPEISSKRNKEEEVTGPSAPPSSSQSQPEMPPPSYNDAVEK